MTQTPKFGRPTCLQRSSNEPTSRSSDSSTINEPHLRDNKFLSLRVSTNPSPPLREIKSPQRDSLPTPTTIDGTSSQLTTTRNKEPPSKRSTLHSSPKSDRPFKMYAITTSLPSPKRRVKSRRLARTKKEDPDKWPYYSETPSLALHRKTKMTEGEATLVTKIITSDLPEGPQEDHLPFTHPSRQPLYLRSHKETHVPR